ncbi:GxxExxY protein [Telmatospirillum siberiense]|uniref:GxxExxY protein n=1 Tax=Telmatospirillum siberiense TaxID=382514 RepID=A0A2N3PXQ1_9PROT|nr:GxxExxY protein [Telmatospirillum siberiense]PKU25190.1 GxxExxY protein [Telmatospirillum siberiense]
MDDLQKDPLTGTVIGAAFEVANTLGHGFLEGVYQKALFHELIFQGVHVEREVPFRVTYKGVNIGVYVADMIVENKLIVELKAVNADISVPQIVQCLNYLRASGLKKGLIVNFGRPRLNFRRVMV